MCHPQIMLAYGQHWDFQNNLVFAKPEEKGVAAPGCRCTREYRESNLQMNTKARVSIIILYRQRPYHGRNRNFFVLYLAKENFFVLEVAKQTGLHVLAAKEIDSEPSL